MKSIQNQYIDLLEGKMSQYNFMRSLRMSLPQYVTNVTSFKDAVKILKNKSILTENLDPNHKRFSDEEINQMKNEYDNLEHEGQSEEDYNQAVSHWLNSKGITEDEWMEIQGEHDHNNYQFGTNVDPLQEIKSTNKIKGGKGDKLTPDRVDQRELYRGIRVEMEHTKDPEKAQEIALDHLAEDPAYYTKLYWMGLDDENKPKKVSKKKRSDVPIEVDKKCSNTKDKSNEMKPVKGYAKEKANANKAKKEAPHQVKGIQLMSLVPKSVRGVKKMDATGEKMKKMKLKENADIYPLPNMESSPLAKGVTTFLKREAPGKEYQVQDNGDKVLITCKNEPRVSDDIKSKLEGTYSVNPSQENPAAIEVSSKNRDYGKVDLGKSFDKFKSQLEEIIRQELNEVLSKKKEEETFDGRDNLVAYEEDEDDYPLNEEMKVKSLKQGQTITLQSDLGKFKSGEQVTIDQIKREGADVKITVSNAKGKTDHFYLDPNDDLND